MLAKNIIHSNNLFLNIYIYLNDTNPIDSHNSCIKILINIRDDDVVSCSFNFIYSKHVHGNASVPITII